ncbi:MAG TPA: sensor histidine kinase [Firmicutes bacterium]|nr:sensor histidine kinase [Bacillota bacterium]
MKKLANVLNKSLKNLRQLELEYKNGNQELKSSITNISHDLRTPLTAIRAYIDLINGETLQPKQKEYFKYIDEKTKDLIELTEQLFDFTKSLENYKDLNKKDICLNSFLENIMGSYYAIFKAKNIEPKISITRNKIIRELDENMLSRIFENIISNSLKYSDGDFNLTLNENGLITISNKSSSLDKTSIKKIFNRYFTVENARKEGGVGLSIAKQLVELNSGTIKAEYKDKVLIISVYF